MKNNRELERTRELFIDAYLFNSDNLSEVREDYKRAITQVYGLIDIVGLRIIVDDKGERE